MTLGSWLCWGIVVLAVAINVGLVLWSRRIIDRISARKLASARDIVKDLRDER